MCRTKYLNDKRKKQERNRSYMFACKHLLLLIIINTIITNKNEKKLVI